MAEQRPAVRYTELRVQVWGDHMNGLPLPSESLRDAVCWPIAPEHKIYLLGSGSAEEERFASLFRKVWVGLPDDVRAVVVRFWDQLTPRTAHYLTQEWAPEIRLSEGWMTKGAENGACTLEGYLFQFDPAVLRREPERTSETRIAHELAHAYLFGTGEAPWEGNPAAGMTDEQKHELVMKKVGCTRENIPACLKRANRTLDQLVNYILSPEEARVDELLRAWGYDPNLLA